MLDHLVISNFFQIFSSFKQSIIGDTELTVKTSNGT